MILVPDEDERALVAEELGEFLRGTFLRDAPLLFASAVTGEGLPRDHDGAGTTAGGK